MDVSRSRDVFGPMYICIIYKSLRIKEELQTIENLICERAILECTVARKYLRSKLSEKFPISRTQLRVCLMKRS